jgi:hypothetical protein
MELRGDVLVLALEKTPGPLISLRDERHLLGRVTKHVALGMVKTGDYFGVGSAVRVRHLRRISPDVHLLPADAAFWDGRGVIRFWSDQECLPRTVGVVPLCDNLRRIHAAQLSRAARTKERLIPSERTDPTRRTV